MRNRQKSVPLIRNIATFPPITHCFLCAVVLTMSFIAQHTFEALYHLQHFEQQNHITKALNIDSITSNQLAD